MKPGSIIPDERGGVELNPLRFDALRNLCIAARFAAEVRTMTPAPSPEAHPTLEELEKAEYVKAYQQAGTIRGAAKLLCIPETTVSNKFQRWRIRPQRIAKNIVRMVACWVLLLPLISFGQIKGSALLPPPLPVPKSIRSVVGGTNTSAQGLAVAAPATNGTITLAWDAAPNAVGYRVYLGPTNMASYNSYALGAVTTATIEKLLVGGNYRAYVTAHDAAGLESVPSNEVTFQAKPAAAKITTTIRIHTFAIETVGVSGKTNVLQESTNTTGGWTDALVFVGDGSVKGILRTNSGNRFYRTVLKN